MAVRCVILQKSFFFSTKIKRNSVEGYMLTKEWLQWCLCDINTKHKRGKWNIACFQSPFVKVEKFCIGILWNLLVIHSLIIFHLYLSHWNHLFFLLLIALIVWPQMDGALMMMSHIISVGHLALFQGLFDNLIHLQNHKSLILSRHSLEMKLLSQRHSGGTAFSHDEWSSINHRSHSLVFSFFLSHEVTFY